MVLSNSTSNVSSQTPSKGTSGPSTKSPPISSVVLDPQFDWILATLSDEQARMAPDPREPRPVPRAAVRRYGEYLQLRRELRWANRTAIALLAVGVLGLVASLPQFQLNLVPFSSPILIMAGYCIYLGGSCSCMGLLARHHLKSRSNASPITASRATIPSTGRLRSLEVISLMVGVSILAWVGYDYWFDMMTFARIGSASIASANMNWLLARGMFGLVFASLSMQLQFVRLLRTSWSY